MEWKEVTLGEIGTIVGGATPSTKNTSFYDGNIPWLTPKDLSVNSNKYIFRGERNITEAGFKSCSCKMLPKGSVLFSSRAPIGYVAIAANDMCTNQGFKSVIPNEETDSEFLYYLLKYNKDNIASQGSGTTFAEVSGKTMKDIEVVVPKEKEDQRRIASILSSLDRKIELNNKINADLEEMAQAIFKNWFVDFEPFKNGKFVNSELGMIPEGWKVGCLGDIAEITSGKRPPKKSKDKTKELFIPLIGASDIMGFTSDVLYERPILVIGRVGTHGVVQRFQEKCWPSDNTLVIESRYYNYVYQLLKGIDYSAINRGSTQPLITQTDVKNTDVIIAPENVLKEYESITSTLFSKHRANIKENSRLSLLRDTLLPRLMSGELEVPE